jgi:hypothetical protein
LGFDAEAKVVFLRDFRRMRPERKIALTHVARHFNEKRKRRQKSVSLVHFPFAALELPKSVTNSGRALLGRIRSFVLGTPMQFHFFFEK